MATVPVRFRMYDISDQLVGAGDEGLAGGVTFTVDVGGQTFSGYARVKQAVGSDYTDKAIEVGAPVGYNGPQLRYLDFASRVTEMVHSKVGPFASGIRLAPGASMRITACSFMIDEIADVETA